MRLFRRRQDSPPAPDPAPGAPALDGQDVARPERSPTGDWMTVAPLPATVRPMTPTFRVQTLPEILTSHQSVRLSGDLGHSVSPEAPSGSVRGLAVTNPGVHEVVGHADLPLRTPHLPEPAPVQPLTVRRLAISESPEPAAAPAPALPEPVVSRVLANPAPLVNPPAAPLPVARVVVDDGLATPTIAVAPSSSASPATEPAPASDTSGEPGPPAAGAPLVGDDRVGGFGVDLEALAAPDSTSQLRRPAPPDLAPPIQPRTLQRRANPPNPPLQRSIPAAAGPAASAPAAPHVEMPLAASRDTGAVAETSAASAAGVAGAPGTAASAGTLVTGAAGTADTMGAAEPDPLPEPMPVQTAPLVGGTPPPTTEAAAPAQPAEPAPAAPIVPLQPATPLATEDPPAPKALAATTPDAPLLAGDLAGVSAPVSESGGTAAGHTSSAPDSVTVGRLDLPLHSPPVASGPGATPSPPGVQRLARTAAPSAARPAASSPPTVAASPSSAAERNVTSSEAPVSGEAVIAPLAGENLLSFAEPAAAAAASPSLAPTPDLPLVVRAGAGDVDPAPSPTAADTTAASGDSPPDEAPAGSAVEPAVPAAAGATQAEPVVLPTLGMGGGDLTLQTSPEAGSSTIAGISTSASAPPLAGVSGLPLAPLEQPGTLGAPAQAGPRTQTSGAPLARPLAAPSSGGAAGPTATTATPLQRAAGSTGTGTSTTTVGPLRTTLQLADPVAGGAPRSGSSPVSPTLPPLQRQGAGGGPAATAAPPPAWGANPRLLAGAGVPAPLGAVLAPSNARPGRPVAPAATSLGPSTAPPAPPVAAGTQVLRRLAAIAGSNGNGAGGPATSLQRIDGTGAPATTNSAANPSSTGTSGTAEPLPLHTPAAAVPSAADVAVKAGLAERQVDGSLLYTSPPGGSAGPETAVQRVNGTGTTAAAPVASPAADPPPDAAAPAAGAPGAGAAGAAQSPQELDLLARRLYKRLRSEMQADIAKQLEAKNRAGRYRR